MEAKAKPGILCYTTEISHRKTCGEIMDLLTRTGASAVGMEIEAESIVAITFLIDTPTLGLNRYRLPIDVAAMEKLLRAKVSLRDQALRTAWRVVKVWLEAQMTMVAARQAALEQVMLPYLQRTEQGETLYEYFVQNHKALPVGKEPA